jgi:hypothetical protein
MDQHHVGNTRVQHRPLIVVVIVFLVLATTYSVVFPLGEINDEIPHFALVRFVAEQHRPPLTIQERDSIGTKGDASPFYHSLIALLTQHTAVTGSTELPEVDQELKRTIPYDGRMLHNIFHTQDDSFPFRGIALAWHLGRLVSIPLGVATLVGVYLVILAIYPDRVYLALAAAAFVAFIPRFDISSAVINDDNLALPLITFAILCLIWVAQGDVRHRTLIILGVLIGLATLAKYHGVVLIPVMTLLLLQLSWQQRWGWRVLLHRWGLVMLAFAITVGWWFVFLIRRFNQIEELGLVSGVLAVLGDPVIAFGVDDLFQTGHSLPVLNDWLKWADLTYRTFWFHSSSSYDGLKAVGRLGFYWLVYVVVGLTTLVAILGLLKRAWRSHRSQKSPDRRRVSWRPDVTVLVVVFLVYLGIVLARFMMQPSFVTAQGRHLFPALASIAFLFVSGWDEALAALNQGKGNSRVQLGSSRDQVLAAGIGGGFLAFSIIALTVFIVPVFYPFLPVASSDLEDIPIDHRLEESFAEGLDFAGFDLETNEPEAGTAMPIILYWHAGDEQARDYLVNLCLYDEEGQMVTCHQGHPVDGRYPTRAWEEDYVIRDRVILPTPACLPGGSYELRLSVLPLRLDLAVTAVDESIQTPASLSLGQVLLEPSQRSETKGTDLWVQDKRHKNGGSIGLTQLRQTVTVIDYQPTLDTPRSQKERALFLSGTNRLATGNGWSPVSPAVPYNCPAGLTATTYSFIVDPAIAPDIYHLSVAGESDASFRVQVLTRTRDFHPPEDIPVKLNAMFGEDLELLGYGIDLSPRQPGDVINITTYWRAWRTMSRSYITSIHLLDDAMTMWGQSDTVLGGTYPHLMWAPGEFVKEDYALTIAPNAPPGLHTIEFGIFHYLKGEYDFLPVTESDNPGLAKHIILGQVRVLDSDHAKAPDTPLTVNLSEQVQLLGFDLSRQDLTTAEPLALALYWQAVDEPTADYTVFTQLIGPDGQVWGQKDNQPQGGRYPTTSWQLQELVVDRYELPLQEGAPSGEYQLLVGMYNLQTGQRLAVIDTEDNRLLGDAIPLTTLQFEREP